MKKFETPEVEIIRYSVIDVITTSVPGATEEAPNAGDNGMGWG